MCDSGYRCLPSVWLYTHTRKDNRKRISRKNTKLVITALVITRREDQLDWLRVINGAITNFVMIFATVLAIQDIQL